MHDDLFMWPDIGGGIINTAEYKPYEKLEECLTCRITKGCRIKDKYSCVQDRIYEEKRLKTLPDAKIIDYLKRLQPFYCPYGPQPDMREVATLLAAEHHYNTVVYDTDWVKISADKGITKPEEDYIREDLYKEYTNQAEEKIARMRAKNSPASADKPEDCLSCPDENRQKCEANSPYGAGFPDLYRAEAVKRSLVKEH